jgi:ADP-ribose pyrophosphatase YjhB (NUDIX family)
MKYIVIPILDRRIITLRDKLDPFLVINIDKENITDCIYNMFSIQLYNYSIVIWEDNNKYVIWYCVHVTKKIQADLLREDHHVWKLPQSIQDHINNLTKNDKEQQRFTFSNYHKNLIVIQTFTCINIQNTDLICLVRDGWETHFTFPWWTCELDETDIQWATREVKEEAQLEIKELHFLGGNIVDTVRPSGETVQSFFQSRFFAKILIDDVTTFISFYNGFETEERIFVKVGELTKYIPRLNYEHGIPIYNKIISLL